MRQAAFDLSYALELLPLLGRGLLVSVQAAVVGTALALLLGLVLALAVWQGSGAIAVGAKLFVSFVRNTPLLVQLYLLFFGLPALGLVLTPLATGVLGLGVHYAAYAAEIFRAGIEAVAPTQWDAAQVLGLSRRQTLFKVVLPQALPPVVPALGNCSIAMLKDTPLLSAITVVEVVQVAQLAGARSFRYLEPMTLVGVGFLLASAVASLAIAALERRVVHSVR